MGSKSSQLWQKFGSAAPGWWELAALGAGLLIVIWLTLRLRAWFRDSDESDENPVLLLSELHDLHREGGLTDEEFRLIKSRLAQAAVGGVASSRTSSTKAGRPAGPPPAEPTGTPDAPADTTPLLGGSGESDSQEAGSTPDGGDQYSKRTST